MIEESEWTKEVNDRITKFLMNWTIFNATK